jgi:hypothetical protein
MYERNSFHMQELRPARNTGKHAATTGPQVPAVSTLWFGSHIEHKAVELCTLIDNYQSFQPCLFILENNDILKPIQEQSVQLKPQVPKSIVPCINEATALFLINMCNHCHCPAPPQFDIIRQRSPPSIVIRSVIIHQFAPVADFLFPQISFLEEL